MLNREYATLSPVPISIAQFLERGGRGKVGSVLIPLYFKGTVCVISNDPPFIEWYVPFTKI